MLPWLPPQGVPNIERFCVFHLAQHGACNAGILRTYSFSEWIPSTGTILTVRAGELRARDGKQPRTASARSEPSGRDSSTVYVMVQPDFKGL